MNHLSNSEVWQELRAEPSLPPLRICVLVTCNVYVARDVAAIIMRYMLLHNVQYYVWVVYALSR